MLIFFFHSKKTVHEAHLELQKVYGDATLNGTTVISSVSSKMVISMLTTVRVKKEQKPSKTITLRHCSNEAITGERYRVQLMRLNGLLDEKGPQGEQRHEKKILQHDNTWAHVAKPVKIYLERLKWEVLPRFPYSPDIAASDCYLFR